MIHCYKLYNKNIVLDIASGSVHCVDDVVYDVIKIYHREYDLPVDTSEDADRDHISRASLARLIREIKQLHPAVMISDILDILDDLDKLIEQGKLFTPDTFEDIAVSKSTKAPALKALCLNVSHTCNMTCEYCFAGTAFDETPDALMTLETGKKAIDFLVRGSAAGKILDVDFFGGEPLLNWQTVKDIVEYARSLEDRVNKKFRFTLTTNGLLIDDDVIAYTNKEFRTVVLSLDGRKETHDKMRKLTGGSGSYDEVLPKIKKMVGERREKGYYIRGTFTRENMDFSNDIFHIAGLGFMEISLEPAVGKRGDPLVFTERDLPEIYRQYDILTTEMLRRRENAKFLREQDVPKQEKEFNFYHYNLDLEDAPCVHKRIAGCGVATEYMAVTPAGDIYPCHQFIGDSKYLLGNVASGIVNQNIRSQFAHLSIYSREKCKSCWARFYCGGGCTANAYRDCGSIQGVHSLGCEIFKKRIENAIMMKFV